MGYSFDDGYVTPVAASRGIKWARSGSKIVLDLLSMEVTTLNDITFYNKTTFGEEWAAYKMPSGQQGGMGDASPSDAPAVDDIE